MAVGHCQRFWVVRLLDSGILETDSTTYTPILFWKRTRKAFTVSGSSTTIEAALKMAKLTNSQNLMNATSVATNQSSCDL